MLLDNKNAIVTGASQGIGKAIASALLNEGARVAGWNRSKPSLTHDRFHSIPADVSDWASVQHAFGETLDILDGKIDILVNNSGIAYSGEFETLPIEKWQQMFRVNVDGIFYCSRLVIPVMKKQGRGHIVNISSIAGLNGVKNLAGYSATKHAVRGISHSLFMELRESGIKVTCIYPGSVRTGLGDPRNDIPLADNPMMPEDIAATVIGVLNSPPNYLTVDVEVRPLKPKG